ncbi:AfsR/SARP family transcriptional regulator [Streptomyces hokutonensis]|uniref:AfsR/SARP family transcriptional regulator n=1 Tax=Streptomyces hokutonensis TaxID=1306990 RepID=A0ABW6MAJ9_9ACTN
MRYEILGSLRITDGDSTAFLSAHKIEALLATLVIRSGQVVSSAHLITEIWGDEPPRRATATLHVYISQLRKFLGRLGVPGVPVATHAPGYVLQLGSATLDVHTFQRLLHEGRGHMKAMRPAEASAACTAALDLWRGDALGDLRGGPTIQRFITWAEEARLECTELLYEANLARGRHRELVAPLSALTVLHPLREAFHQQLMLALYRSERTSEALGVYESLRKTLDDELGIEPCRALRALRQAILVSDARLDIAPAVRGRIKSPSEQAVCVIPDAFERSTLVTPAGRCEI